KIAAAAMAIGIQAADGNERILLVGRDESKSFLRIWRAKSLGIAYRKSGSLSRSRRAILSSYWERQLAQLRMCSSIAIVFARSSSLSKYASSKANVSSQFIRFLLPFGAESRVAVLPEKDGTSPYPPGRPLYRRSPYKKTHRILGG